VISTKRGDGKVNEHILAEDIEGKCTAAVTSGQATWTLKGEAAETDMMSHNWPKGSATNTTLTSLVGSSSANVLSNGSFATEDTNAEHVPDGWVADIATLGTTLKLSDVEVQTVIISGTPTGGHYLLHYTDSGSNISTTVPLVYNAAASAVQSALRSLSGLSEVTVSATGTSPNFTHTITFVNVTNPNQLTSTDNMTGGTPGIAHATPTAASANVIRGARSVEMDANGSENTAIAQELSLTAETQYAFCIHAKVDVAPAAGVITVSLNDGLTGSATVLNDEAGTANSFTIDATGLTTAWSNHTGVFRTAKNLVSPVWLRIHQSTAVSAGTSVFLDQAILTPMTQLYTGGLYAALFTGDTDWDVDDLLTLPVTNDRAGAIHEWFNRTFSLRTNNLLLPTDTGGTETQADTLIA
jgi:hypothetical protein